MGTPIKKPRFPVPAGVDPAIDELAQARLKAKQGTQMGLPPTAPRAPAGPSSGAGPQSAAAVAARGDGQADDYNNGAAGTPDLVRQQQAVTKRLAAAQNDSVQNQDINELALLRQQQAADKAKILEQTAARAGFGGMGLSGAASTQMADTSRVTDRANNQAVIDTQKAQADAAWKKTQREAVLDEMEAADVVDYNHDGMIAGQPAPKAQTDAAAADATDAYHAELARLGWHELPNGGYADKDGNPKSTNPADPHYDRAGDNLQKLDTRQSRANNSADTNRRDRWGGH